MSDLENDLVCARCNMRIDRDQQRVFALVGNLSEPQEPILVRIQRADEPVLMGWKVFNSITCVKKWLLDWVDVAAHHGACTVIEPGSNQSTGDLPW